jgi:hypothetical protein
VQAPNLVCWHCQARLGEAVCVNCPQKNTKRAAKRVKESPMPPTRALLGSSGVSNVIGAAAVLAAAGEGDYDGVSSEGRGGPANDSMDDNNFGVGENPVRMRLPLHASPVSDLRYIGPLQQQQPPPSCSIFSEKVGSLFKFLSLIQNNSAMLTNQSRVVFYGITLLFPRVGYPIEGANG